MSRTVRASCFKCGNHDDRDVVVSGGPPGRVLVFCRTCRVRLQAEKPDELRVVVPAHMVDDEVLEALLHPALTHTTYDKAVERLRWE
jgi:hypothetical protein